MCASLAKHVAVVVPCSAVAGKTEEVKGQGKSMVWGTDSQVWVEIVVMTGGRAMQD